MSDFLQDSTRWWANNQRTIQHTSNDIVKNYQENSNAWGNLAGIGSFIIGWGVFHNLIGKNAGPLDLPMSILAGAVLGELVQGGVSNPSNPGAGIMHNLSTMFNMACQGVNFLGKEIGDLYNNASTQFGKDNVNAGISVASAAGIVLLWQILANMNKNKNKKSNAEKSDDEKKKEEAAGFKQDNNNDKQDSSNDKPGSNWAMDMGMNLVKTAGVAELIFLGFEIFAAKGNGLDKVSIGFNNWLNANVNGVKTVMNEAGSLMKNSPLQTLLPLTPAP
jgi:hypothetical protein